MTVGVVLRRGFAVGLVVGLAAIGGWMLTNRWAWAALHPHTGPQPVPPEGLGSLRAEGCAACHPAETAAWNRSRMGNAMANTGFLSDWRAQEELGACLACHAPFQDQQAVVVNGVWTVLPWLILDTDPHPGFDPAFQAEGVTCMACHRAENGQVAVERVVDAPHGTSVVEGLGEVCVRCHQMVTSPLDFLPRPIIDTADEHRSWKATTGRTESCADCHMGGDRGHEFDGAELSGGLSVDLTPTDSGWRIEVENLAGHHLPTGETSGALDLWVDVDGKISRVARFTRVIVGPPWREQSDTTLRPAERRSWTIDGGDSIRVTARAERLVHLPSARQAALEAGESVQEIVVLAEANR